MSRETPDNPQPAPPTQPHADRTKICLFLPHDAATALKVIAARQPDCRGVSDVVEGWIRRAGVPAATGYHPALCLCDQCVPPVEQPTGEVTP